MDPAYDVCTDDMHIQHVVLLFDSGPESTADHTASNWQQPCIIMLSSVPTATNAFLAEFAAHEQELAAHKAGHQPSAVEYSDHLASVLDAHHGLSASHGLPEVPVHVQHLVGNGLQTIPWPPAQSLAPPAAVLGATAPKSPERGPKRPPGIAGPGSAASSSRSVQPAESSTPSSDWQAPRGEGHAQGSAPDSQWTEPDAQWAEGNASWWSDPAYLREETEVAIEMGIPWQMRGPAREHHEGRWRNQVYRESSGRWGNRGGQGRQWHQLYYSVKGQKGAAAASDYADEQTGKGKGSKAKGGKDERGK